MQIIILTGMSGAGKSSAGQVLEDLGYYKVDNMPVSMLAQLVSLCSSSGLGHEDIVYTVDVRASGELSKLPKIMSDIQKQHRCTFRTVFMDASDEVIVKRYKESRHIHPYVVAYGITLAQALEKERRELSFLREISDDVIDTSDLRISQMRDRISELLEREKPGRFTVTFMTFGFKYGVPIDTDLVFDVRCFANPHYDPSMRVMTGLEKPVRDFVLSDNSASEFLKKLEDMLAFLVPLYMAEGKAQLTVGIGCTGGRHRSVTFAYELFNRFENKFPDIRSVLCHRDIEKITEQN